MDTIAKKRYLDSLLRFVGDNTIEGELIIARQFSNITSVLRIQGLVIKRYIDETRIVISATGRQSLKQNTF